MGRSHWFLGLALAGCADIAGIGDPMPAHGCVIGGLDLCLSGEPQNPLVIDADLVVNTTTDCSVVVYTPPQPSLCVLYASDVTINAKLSAIGSRPLVIAAVGTLTVNGSVDVSSYRGKSEGAAANDRACKQSTGIQMLWGGAAGGSFQGRGGAGGSGYQGDAGEQPGIAVELPSFLRGGCAGGGGRFPDTGNGGGSGGGAVWLAAGTAIDITANGKVVSAGGGGGGANGTSGNEGGGGGGGGSGGFIRLAASAVTIAGVVAANGGGGSEGGAMMVTQPPMPGADGGASATPAVGGASTAPGGDGGGGGAATAFDGGSGGSAMPAVQAGGGGGGGGVGFIQIIADMTSTTGTISPSSK